MSFRNNDLEAAGPSLPRESSIDSTSSQYYTKKTIRQDIYAASLEFCGTVLFLLLGLGGVQSAVISRGASDNLNVAATTDQLVYESAAMGLSLLVTAWIFYRVTGGLFNPNVSLSLLLVNAISPLRFVMYAIAQLLGAIVASALLQVLMPGPLLVNTAPGSGTSKTQAVFIEMFITAALCFAVLMLAAEKHRVTAFAPIGVGLTLFVGELWAIQFTGGSMNTARSFGPAVVTSFDKSHWVYWVGPLLGSLLATAFYRGLKFIKYQRLNPNQDSHMDDLVSATTGVNGLKMSTQMATVNGVPMVVATIPFTPLPGADQTQVGSKVPMPITLVFDQSGVMASVDHRAGIHGAGRPSVVSDSTVI